ncbi:hypothetical protein [Cupriavidus necator]
MAKLRKTGNGAQSRPAAAVFGVAGGNYLVSRLGSYETRNEVYKAIGHAYCGGELKRPPPARSRKTRISLALEDAFFPTGEELEGGERILAAIQMLTQARGNDFVEVNQNTARLCFNAQMQSYSLARAQHAAPVQWWLVICGPLSMLLHKLLYALRSVLGPIHCHDSVQRFNEQGEPIATIPTDLKQIPLLIVHMPVHPTERGLYFAVLDALAPFFWKTDILEIAGLSRRRSEAFVPTLIKGLLNLHVGAIAIVGMRSVHAQAAQLPKFYAALEWLAACGIGVITQTSPFLPEMAKANMSPLLWATEPQVTVNRYHDDDLANVAKHWWALLERDEPVPTEIVPLLGNVCAQRELVLMLFKQLHYDLHVERRSIQSALKDIVARACATRARQIELWQMPMVPYADGLVYRDWLPQGTSIAEPERPNSRFRR